MLINEKIRKMADEGFKRQINEDVYTNSFTLNQKLKQYLDNDKFVIVLLTGMYGRQVDFEKAGNRTVLKNFKGFNQTDAGYLTPLAKKVEDGEVLTANEIKFVRSRLKTYRNTQWDQVLQEMGYITVNKRPGRKPEFVLNEEEFQAETGINLDHAAPSAEDDFVNAAIAAAEEMSGVFAEEDLSAARSFAANLFHSGLISPIDAAERINAEF